MLFELPTPAEFNDIADEFPCEELKISEDDFSVFLNPAEFRRFSDESSIGTWRLHLQNRIYQTRTSYVIMKFLINKGIPDERWFAPGEKGGIKFYPDFEKEDYIRKAQFDYFADVYFLKLYSCLDSVGHLLNLCYDLQIAKPDFHRALNKLTGLRPELYFELKKIKDSESFIAFKHLRHGIAHNELPGHVSGFVHKVSENEYTLGAGRYTPTREIIRVGGEAIKAFLEVLRPIRKQMASETTSILPASKKKKPGK